MWTVGVMSGISLAPLGAAGASLVPPRAIEGSFVEAAADERFMRLALAQAELAVMAGEVPVGCVFVCGGEVVGSGFNATNAEFDATRHAELVAADQVLFSGDCSIAGGGAGGGAGDGVLEACDLFVTCEPCLMCADALARLRVRRVVFGCHNDRFGGCGSILALHEGRYPIRAGVLKDEAVAMFRRFYSRENSRAPEAKRKRKDGTRADDGCAGPGATGDQGGL